MNTVKRLFISIKQQIDNVAEDFEDHQAVISAAIAELDEVGANTQIQLNQIRNEIVDLKTGIEQAQRDSQRWADRARKIHHQDEAKALECVKRIKTLDDQTKHLAEHIDQCLETERQLLKDLDAMNTKRAELKIKKDNLSSRENRTLADQVLAGSQHGVVSQVDKVLERWENRIVSKEYKLHGTHELKQRSTVDPLQHEFELQEEAQQLKQMLDQLTKPDDQDSNVDQQ